MIIHSDSIFKSPMAKNLSQVCLIVYVFTEMQASLQ